MLPPRSFSSLVSQTFQEQYLLTYFHIYHIYHIYLLSYLSSDVSKLHLSGLVSYSYIQKIQ